jgi:lipoprotein-releasing system ATP-binding protein
MSLVLNAVTFTYRGASRPVLHDVNLTVRHGEVVALMAPSGAGKSTLLAIAGVLLAPDEGTVQIDGIARTPKHDGAMLGASVAWIPQSANLLPRRSAIDNVALVALAHGHRRKEARSLAVGHLASVGITDGLDRRAGSLSGGEAQRVAIARAMAFEPSVLLVDEPTASLDHSTAMVVAKALEVASSRSAVLIATHDPAVADVCDRVLRIVDGALRTEVPA